MVRVLRNFMSIALVLTILVLGGCDSSEQGQPSSPTVSDPHISYPTQGAYDSKAGEYFQYRQGELPGITVLADLTKYHREGQPYGIWVINATWRDQSRHHIAEENQMLQVSPEGIGAALLSADFLAAVFAEAHRQYTEEDGKTFAWHENPGLYLNIYPDDITYAEYYKFEGGMFNGWSFGGSLVSLVDSIEGFVWWPAMQPPVASTGASDESIPIGPRSQTVPAVLVNIAEPYHMIQTSTNGGGGAPPPCTKSVTLPGGADGVKFLVDTSGCLTGTVPYTGQPNYIQRQDANASTVTNVSCTCATGGPVGASNLPTGTPTDCSVTPGNDGPCQKQVGGVSGCGLPATCTW